MAGPIRIAILANGAGARRDMRATAAVGTSMGSSLSKAGRLAAVGLGAAGFAAVAIAKRTVTAASSAQQSVGATESVYGKYADTVIRRSEQAAKAVGLSANEYRELANVSGAMLKSSELPLRRVTDLTAQLTRRASDVAATFGGTTREAVEAFNALLRGETDPVERYGVAIKQTDITARLAAKGQDELTGSSLKQASALARLELLFKQTKSSQGQFRRESDTLAGQQQRLSAEVENLEAKVGAVLLPTLTDLAIWTRRNVVPALEDAADWFERNQDEISGAASAIGGELLDGLRRVQPYLETGVEFAKAAADAWSSLPGPVKDVAMQAGIAAAVFPRFNGVVGGGISALTDFATQARNAETRTAALSRAARSAAGIGGILAIAQGAQQSNTALQGLANIGGGALLGFSVGGPIGAAVGGTAGALLTLAQNAGKAGDAAEIQVPKFENLKDTLDGLTAATTEQTKASVLQGLQSNGTLQTLNQYGISSRAAVNAILGETKARSLVGRAIQSERVMRNAALTEATRLQREYDTVVGSGTAEENRRQELAGLIEGYKGEAAAHEQVIATIQKATGKYREDVRAKRQEIAATRDYTGLLKGLPPRVRTRINADGIEPTKKAVVNLARQYKLTPRQIKTTLKAAGFEGTRKQVEDVRKRIDNLKTAKPNLSPALRAVTQFSLDAKRQAIVGATGVADNLKKGTGKAKANLVPFRSSLTTGISTAKTTAGSGGSQIGNALGQGMYSGVGAWASSIATRAASIVSAAVAAAKAAGKIKSPSQVMRDQVGKQLGAGLVVGLRAKEKDAEKAGKSIIRKLLRGVDDGSQGIGKVLDRITGLIDKRLDGKKQAGRRKALLKSLKDKRAALTANGKAQDKNSRLLEKATQKYKSLTQAAKDYAAGIRSGIVGYGSVVGLGTTGGGTAVSLEAMISQLTARAGVAEQFAAVIEKLRGKLNKTSLQQLLDAAASGDLEGALASAQAIASGGSAAVAQINQLTSQIGRTGEKLGDKMKDQFHGAGLQAAEGLVRGLKKKQRDLDRVAERLAESLVKKVKKALGIKSPSRVFQAIGDQTVAGLTLSFRANDTHVRRTAADLASSLQKGFGTPALDAYMSTSGGSSSAPTVVVDLQLTAQQISELEQGRRIQAKLDVYHGAGGRAKVKTA